MTIRIEEPGTNVSNTFGFKQLLLLFIEIAKPEQKRIILDCSHCEDSNISLPAKFDNPLDMPVLFDHLFHGGIVKDNWQRQIPGSRMKSLGK
ncbi:hypothetical protein D3C72_909980 [compost metagenome]